MVLWSLVVNECLLTKLDRGIVRLHYCHVAWQSMQMIEEEQ